MIQSYSLTYTNSQASQPIRFQGTKSSTPSTPSAKDVVEKWSMLQAEERVDFDREYDRRVVKNKINTALCEALAQCESQDVVDALVAKLKSTPATQVLSPRINTIAIASMHTKDQALALIDAFTQRAEQQEQAKSSSIRRAYPFTSQKEASANDLRNHAFIDKQHYFPAGFDPNQIFAAIDILDDVISHHL